MHGKPSPIGTDTPRPRRRMNCLDLPPPTAAARPRAAVAVPMPVTAHADIVRHEFVLPGRPRLVASTTGSDDGCPVVLLHGAGQTRHAWDKAALELAAAGFRAVSVDLRGHGESGWAPDRNYDPAAYAGDVRALLRTLGRPAFLVGNSLGAQAALLAAGESPGVEVAGVVVIDVASDTPGGVGVLLRRLIDASAAGFPSLETAATAVESARPDTQRPLDRSRLLRSLRQGDDGRLHWHWDPATREAGPVVDAASCSARLSEAARNLRCPLLLIERPAANSPCDEALRRAVSGVGTVLTAGSDPSLPGVGNEACVAALVEFLSRTAAASVQAIPRARYA